MKSILKSFHTLDAKIRLPLYVLITAAISIAISGDIMWTQLYLFYLTFTVGFSIVFGLLYKNNKGLFDERINPSGREQISEDKKLMKFIGLACATTFIFPFIDHRFKLSPQMPKCAEIVGLLGLISSCVVIHYTFVYNSFASPLAKLQKERGHKVISSGPYSIVRHPMYFSFLLMMLGSSLSLNSLYSIYLVVITTTVFMYRAKLEEELLINEFGDEYIQYRKKVKYMIIPFIL